MSKETSAGTQSLGDTFALKLQELHRANRLHGNQPLLKIDNREEAEQAPYQFDTALGKLHKKGCKAIPESSRSALYGLWKIGEQERKYACAVCSPAPREPVPGEQRSHTDLLYGLLSIVDQFSGVLMERGREYRKSKEGRDLGAGLEGVYQELDNQEKQIVDVVISSLDGVIGAVRQLDDQINEGTEPDETPGGEEPPQAG